MANAATREIVAAKFLDLCRGPLGPEQADRALEILSGMSALASLRTVPAAFAIRQNTTT